MDPIGSAPFVVGGVYFLSLLSLCWVDTREDDNVGETAFVMELNLPFEIADEATADHDFTSGLRDA